MLDFDSTSAGASADCAWITGKAEVIQNALEYLGPIWVPLTVPESSLQRQRWLPVPLNVNQLPLNWTLTR